MSNPPQGNFDHFEKCSNRVKGLDSNCKRIKDTYKEPVIGDERKRQNENQTGIK